MKKMITLLLASVMTLSLVACGSSKPSEEEVIASIEAGTLTIEDAVEKGYVDEQWVEDYRAENSVEASKKSEANMLAAFETENLAGEAFTDDDLTPVTFIAFLNPNSEDAIAQYNILAETYDAVVATGADILIVNTTGEDSDLFADAKFEVVSYNDSMKTAMGTLVEMVNEDGFVGSWNVNNSFLSAWYMSVDADSFVETGKSMVDTLTQPEQGADAMVPMG